MLRAGHGIVSAPTPTGGSDLHHCDRMPGDGPTDGPGRRAPVGRLASALAAVALLGAGCGDDGRELRPPSPDQTTSTTVPAQSTTALPDQMVLSSPAIPQGGEIGIDHTCRGLDVSPPLTWTPPPETTVELAVVVRDVDAGGLVHWVVAGLPPGATGLEQGVVPPEAVEATNDLGHPGWSGPCPEAGTHTYEVRVYALAQPSGVTPGQPGSEAAAQVESTPAVMSAVLSGWATAPG